MKHTAKIFVAALVLCASSSAFAQLFMPKGSVIGGGGIAFSSETEKVEDELYGYEEKITTFAFNPEGMYFVIDNLGVGAMLSFENTKRTEDDYEQKGSTFAFMPMVRYYFGEGPFVQAAYGFGSSKTNTDYGGSVVENKIKISGFEFGPGYSVRITESILFEPMIGYRAVKNTPVETEAFEQKTSGFFIRVGFTMILVTK